MCDERSSYFGGDGRFSVEWLVPIAPRFLQEEELRGYRLGGVWFVCFEIVFFGETEYEWWETEKCVELKGVGYYWKGMIISKIVKYYIKQKQE